MCRWSLQNAREPPDAIGFFRGRSSHRNWPRFCNRLALEITALRVWMMHSLEKSLLIPLLAGFAAAATLSGTSISPGRVPSAAQQSQQSQPTAPASSASADPSTALRDALAAACE